MPRWIRPLALLAFVGAVLLAREINKFDPEKEHFTLLSAFIRGVAFGWFVVYCVPWFFGLARYDIFIYPDYIQTIGSQMTRPFKTMIGFHWSLEDGYFVLNLVNANNRTLSYGVPDIKTRDRIDEALARIGVKRIAVQARQ